MYRWCFYRYIYEFRCFPLQPGSCDIQLGSSTACYSVFWVQVARPNFSKVCSVTGKSCCRLRMLNSRLPSILHLLYNDLLKFWTLVALILAVRQNLLPDQQYFLHHYRSCYYICSCQVLRSTEESITTKSCQWSELRRHCMVWFFFLLPVPMFCTQFTLADLLYFLQSSG